jgi:hypothetical protein
MMTGIGKREARGINRPKHAMTPCYARQMRTVPRKRLLRQRGLPEIDTPRPRPANGRLGSLRDV